MPAHILIVHRGALGDFILTWPALTLLRRKYPRHKLTVVGRPDYCRLAVALGVIDVWHDCESPEMLPLFTGTAPPAVLDKAEYAVLWLSSGETAARLLTAHDLRVILAAPFPPQPMHAACYHMEIISRFCGLPQSDPMKYHLPGRPLAHSHLTLIHPGSGSANKNYSPSMYLRIADMVKKHGGDDVRFILGPAEDGLPSAFAGQSIVRPNSTTALAELLRPAALYIGNDSGVSHLAGVLGVPSVVLYKTTDPAVWGVMGPRVRQMKAQTDAEAEAVFSNLATAY
jgi:ADP-heptose:LPS heptosyltransferase